VYNDPIITPEVSSISIESSNKRKETSVSIDDDLSASSAEDFSSGTDTSHSDSDSEDDDPNHLVAATDSRSTQGYDQLNMSYINPNKINIKNVCLTLLKLSTFTNT
jgi:hypothetical protein